MKWKAILAGFVVAVVPAASSFATEYWSVRLTSVVGESKVAGDLRELCTSGSTQSVCSSAGGGGTDLWISLDSIPDGATITKITVWGYDNSSGSVTSYLYTQAVTSETASLFTSWASSNGVSVWNSGTIAAGVNTAAGTYMVRINIPGGIGTNLRVHTLRVEYTP